MVRPPAHAALLRSVACAAPQRKWIEAKAAERGLKNLKIYTGNIVTWEALSGAGEKPFDRVISIEMMEHMKNYEKLLVRVGQALLRKQSRWAGRGRRRRRLVILLIPASPCLPLRGRLCVATRGRPRCTAGSSPAASSSCTSSHTRSSRTTSRTTVQQWRHTMALGYAAPPRLAPLGLRPLLP